MPRAYLEHDELLRKKLSHNGTGLGKRKPVIRLSESARNWVNCLPLLYSCEVRLARKLAYGDGTPVGEGFGWCANPTTALMV